MATCHGTLGSGHLWSTRLHPHTFRGCSSHQVLHNKFPPRWCRVFWSRGPGCHWLCLQYRRPIALVLIDQLFQHARRMHKGIQRATCPRLSPQSPWNCFESQGEFPFRRCRHNCPCWRCNTSEPSTTQTTLLLHINMPNLRAVACCSGCCEAATSISGNLQPVPSPSQTRC